MGQIHGIGLTYNGEQAVHQLLMTHVLHYFAMYLKHKLEPSAEQQAVPMTGLTQIAVMHICA
jgi:hypothetical protein